VENVKEKWRYAVTIILICWMLFPIVWLAFLSIKPESAILGDPFAPFNPTCDHYLTLFARFRFGEATLNSLAIALAVLAITIPVASLAAYGLTRFPFPGVQWVMIFLLFCRILIPSILVLPLYQIVNLLNLRGTIWSIVLGHLAWSLPFAIILLNSFLAEMPKEMEEAAWLDGLSRWKTFLKIVFPLMAPSVATVGLFTFGVSWGEFLFAVSLTAVTARTGPVQISMMTTEYKVWWGALAASGIYWSTPIIIIALLFNKWMTRGLRLS